MAVGQWPYSRANEAMKPPDPDDDPSKIPQEDGKVTSQWNYPVPNIQDATDDVGGAAWGQSETYRRLNCRGK